MQFTSERDLVRHFTLSNIAVRPEAAALLFQTVAKLPTSELRTAYMETMIKKLKEKQAILIHGSVNGGGQVIVD